MILLFYHFIFACSSNDQNRKSEIYNQEMKKVVELEQKLNQTLDLVFQYVQKTEQSITINKGKDFQNQLEDLIKQAEQIVNNSMKARIVVDICHGMSHIHKLGWIHRDLKIDNIMLNSIFNAKIVDFGLVRFNEFLSNESSFVKNSMSKGVGTMAYMSPEMLNEDEYNEKTDVFSFGIVLFYIFVGKLPDYKMRDRMAAKPINLPDESDSISRFCLDLIARCTAAEPADRPSFDQILNELRRNDFRLAGDVDKEFVEKRDKELISFD